MWGPLDRDGRYKHNIVMVKTKEEWEVDLFTSESVPLTKAE